MVRIIRDFHWYKRLELKSSGLLQDKRQNLHDFLELLHFQVKISPFINFFKLFVFRFFFIVFRFFTPSCSITAYLTISVSHIIDNIIPPHPAGKWACCGYSWPPNDMLTMIVRPVRIQKFSDFLLFKVTPLKSEVQTSAFWHRDGAICHMNRLGVTPWMLV